MSPDAATTNDNVINLADRVEARFQRRIPILEATGISVDPWEGELLSGDLKKTGSSLGLVLAMLTDKAVGKKASCSQTYRSASISSASGWPCESRASPAFTPRARRPGPV